MMPPIWMIIRSASVQYRFGQIASGGTNYESYRAHPEKKDSDFEPEIEQAFLRGDFLRIADILEWEILPKYPATALTVNPG